MNNLKEVKDTCHGIYYFLNENNKKEGEFKSYAKKDVIRYSLIYINGVRNGNFIYNWNNTNKPNYLGFYKNDRIDGECLNYKYE